MTIRYGPHVVVRVATAVLISAAMAAAHAAGPFERRTVALEHPANGDVVHLQGTSYLAVTGHSSSRRWLSLVDMVSLSARQVTVPEDVQFVAAGRLAGDAGERLFVLGARGVGVVEAEEDVIRPLVDTTSIYRRIDAKRLRQLAFVHDITGNGLADLLIPDFDTYHAFIQHSDGEFARFSLPIGAELRTLEGAASYVARVPYVVDFSLDGRADVVFVDDGRFLVFRQLEHGVLAEIPLVHAPGIYLTPDLEADLRPGDGRDFAGLVVHRVQDFADLNGDGLADLVVRRQQHQDGIEQHDSYRVHYGRRGEHGLTFTAEADAHIETTGMQLEPIFADVNGNGRHDFGTATATLGLGTIIRALVTGAAGMEVLFYAMDERGQFRSEPDYRQGARVEISMRSRQIDMPLLRLADLNGSGRKSLLVSEGREVLWIYPGDVDALFARRGERVRVTLPRDASAVLVADLTGNGRDDVVLPFGPRDGEGGHRLELLLSR